MFFNLFGNLKVKYFVNLDLLGIVDEWVVGVEEVVGLWWICWVEWLYEWVGDMKIVLK